MGLLLFVVSALPVVVIAWIIWHKDKEKEPPKLLIKLFAGGFLSCLLVVIISLVLQMIFPFFAISPEFQSPLQLFISVFVGVALVEEFSKWLMVYLFSFRSKDFDYFYDGIVYSVFVALGFAFFENLLYVYGGGLATGIMRALLAVPGHASDGIFMGYYLGLAKTALLNDDPRLVRRNLVLSIIVPTILHGIYDYCLFAANVFFVLVFFAFVIFMYIVTIRRVKRVSNIKRKMRYKDNYCPICGRIVESDFCPNCGRKNE